MGYGSFIIFFMCLFIVVIQAMGRVVALGIATYGYVAGILLQLPCQFGGMHRSFLQNRRGPGKSVTQYTKILTMAPVMIVRYGSINCVDAGVCKKLRQLVMTGYETCVT